MTDLAISKLFNRSKERLPEALSDWGKQIEMWYQDYCVAYKGAELSEIILDLAVFLFDHRAERVILAYAISTNQLMRRDTSRMRGFPDVNVSIRKSLQRKAFVADKGHFLGHASGGILDINLFPHRRELNRGWSSEGKRFRKMERYVEQHPGTFFYHRPIYDDETWIPSELEYGVLIDRIEWWVEVFQNK